MHKLIAAFLCTLSFSMLAVGCVGADVDVDEEGPVASEEAPLVSLPATKCDAQGNTCSSSQTCCYNNQGQFSYCATKPTPCKQD